MRIVIDFQSRQSTGSRNRGIGRYSTDLLKAMANQSGNRELWLALNGNFSEPITRIKKDFSDYVPADRIFVYEVPDSCGMQEPYNDWRRQASERIREHAIGSIKPDVLHVSSLFEGLGDDAVTSVRTLESTTTAVTLYDLIPLIKAETYLQNAAVKAWYYAKLDSLKKADLLLAISESSRQEALDMLGLSTDKVVTVSTAVPRHFKPVQLSSSEAQALQARHGLKRPFVMYTGGIDHRKNIEGLIEAYGKLPPDVRSRYQLAIVCSITPYNRNRLLALASRYQLTSDDVILTGFVSEEDLVGLYNLCTLFVFPSLHEGFGLPALEAMSCGAVVIGSNTSSIPEVIGRDDALFDPTRTELITQAIYKGLMDSSFRESLREFAPQQVAKFSWESSAKKTLDAFDQLYEQRQSALELQVQVPRSYKPGLSKPRLAFVSPLPPEKSGIAEYSAELLPFLSKHYDITVIVNNMEGSLAVEKNIAVQSVDWFLAHAEAFERRIYQFGNSSLHHHMFDLLDRYPGLVVLHDFYLSGALIWMDTFVGPPGILAIELYCSHGYTALLAMFKEGIDKAVTRFPSNQSVISNATKMIVHSQHSKAIANKWYGEGASNSWCIIPQLHTSSPSLSPDISKQQARAELGLGADDFVVCSFGIVAPTKLNSRLVDAWMASELSDNKRCHLIFVGENHKSEYGQKLNEVIDRPKLSTRIEITGFISTASYRQYLAAADVAVQLRTLSRGETSRAVLEALTYKLPLIINSHGSMAEYPDDVLTKLPDDFSDYQLAEAMEALYEDAELRQALGQAGYQYVSEHHAPDKVALRYRDVIEECITDSPHTRYQRLLDSFKEIESTEPYRESDLVAVAEAIARNTQKFGKPQLLVDISSWKQDRLDKQNQQILKASIVDLLKQPTEELLESYRVEPIYFDGKIYRYARRSTLQLLNLNLVNGLVDDPVDIGKKDLFLGVDTETVVSSESLYHVMKWHQAGVKLYLTVFNDISKQLYQGQETQGQKTTTETEALVQVLFSTSSRILCFSSEIADSIAKSIETYERESIESTNNLPDICCLSYSENTYAKASLPIADFLSGAR